MKKFQNENEERLSQLTEEYSNKLMVMEEDRKATWVVVSAYGNRPVCTCIHGTASDIISCLGLAVAGMVGDSDDPVADAERYLDILSSSVVSALKIREKVGDTKNAKQAVKAILEGLVDVLDD